MKTRNLSFNDFVLVPMLMRPDSALDLKTCGFLKQI